jgi:hypothetical protein
LINFAFVRGHKAVFQKKVKKMFGGSEKTPYLCTRYPENNLFTLEN